MARPQTIGKGGRMARKHSMAALCHCLCISEQADPGTCPRGVGTPCSSHPEERRASMWQAVGRTEGVLGRGERPLGARCCPGEEGPGG